MLLRTLLIGVVIIPFLSFSQTWPKYYGEPNQEDYSNDIAETYDMGYLIAGNFSTNGGSGYKKWSWLIKTDINGDILWEKIIEGGDEFTSTSSIENTEDGGVLMAGYISEFGISKPFVMKLNECGEKEWCTVFASSTQTNPWAQDIKETSSGEIIVLINQYGENNVEDMDLFKLGENGNLLWRKTYCSGNVYPEAGIPFGRSLSITSQDDYLITGYVYWEDPWNPGGPKGLRPLYVKVDSIGNEKWVLPFGLNDTIIGQANNTIEISNELFICVGRYVDIEAGINRKGLIMKFDILGYEIDYNIIDFNQINEDFDVGLFWDILPVDSVYILASYFGNQQWPNTAPPGEVVFDTTDIFTNSTVIKYNHYIDNNEPYNIGLTSTSKILSISVYEEPSNWDIQLSKLNLNLEYDTAYPGNYIYDSLCTEPGQPQTGFIYLDDCDIITNIDIPSPQEYFSSLNTIPIKAYPNPVNGNQITFQYLNTKHNQSMELRCFNVFGEMVHKEKVYQYQGESKVNVGDWNSGMYIAIIYSYNKVVGQTKFVVQ